MCLPLPTFRFRGDRHDEKPSPSRLHSNVEPAIDDENSNVACLLFVLDLGCAVIVVSGGGGGGQAPCVEASVGQPSWVSSPKPSPSASGSSTAAMSY